METFVINDDYRVVVDTDDYADNPLSWAGSSVECYPLGASRLLDTDSFTVNAHDIEDILWYARMYGGVADNDDLVAALDKHYDRKGWSHCVYSLVGPCGDWVDLYIAMDQAAYCDASAFASSELQMYWDREVYTFELQKRHAWRDDAGDTMYTWDTVDTIGGVYCSDLDSEWRECAASVFDVNVMAVAR